MVKTSVAAARTVMMAALRGAGVPESNAAIQADLLLEAELRGRASHGLLRLPRVIERINNGVANATTTGKATWRASSFLEVDGEGGLGPVVAHAALDAICARARETGIAVAAIHSNNHIGMLALYAERVALAGQCLIALSTSEALVHPWGGRKAMLGTNPIAIGVPAEPAPFVLDMATSVVAMGKIHDYANRGQELDTGWALDHNGDPTTDAQAAKQGALAPFGDAKGYALGLAFEVLVAGLTASALGNEVTGTLDSTQPANKGDLFIVLDGGNTSLPAVSGFLEAIRSCPPADPARPVLVPGDRARIERQRSMNDGLKIATDVWTRIHELAGLPITHTNEETSTS